MILKGWEREHQKASKVTGTRKIKQLEEHFGTIEVNNMTENKRNIFERVSEVKTGRGSTNCRKKRKHKIAETLYITIYQTKCY